MPGLHSGSFKPNLVTLVWEDSWKESKPCELRIIEKGLGVKYTTNNDTIFHLWDPAKQLDYIYVMKNSSVCGNESLVAFYPVLGMYVLFFVQRYNTHREAVFKPNHLASEWSQLKQNVKV
ncbi:hypothetical protein OUZ56_012726 [Daphnia magna]|uniref:Uncharacterized protein n=1 Tax=Daphnia magna TaxID=35525 RepID=A0ABQ9Z3V1_9CRUS|nr:hypothetical protein OUZ56_012726 [Daphnia magna]